MATDSYALKRTKPVPTNRGYEPSRVVHVRNLPEDIDMEAVSELGRPFGKVLSVLKIKDTQAFLFMEDLKAAEELVNEYRLRPPKIGWRTVFVQYSQYSRLDVGTKKNEPFSEQRQGGRDSDTSSSGRSRRRSRDSRSRRSSSPESLSPPLPDISVPFYMLPRTDDNAETASLQFVSRPQLVSYPQLSKPALSQVSTSLSQTLMSYPCPTPGVQKSSQTGVGDSSSTSDASLHNDISSVVNITGINSDSSLPHVPLMSGHCVPRQKTVIPLMSCAAHVPPKQTGPMPLMSIKVTSPEQRWTPYEFEDTSAGQPNQQPDYNDYSSGYDIPAPSEQWDQYETNEEDYSGDYQQPNPNVHACSVDRLHIVFDRIADELDVYSQRISSGDGQFDLHSQLSTLDRNDIDLVLSVQQQHGGSHNMSSIIGMLHALRSFDPDTLSSVAELDLSAINSNMRLRPYCGGEFGAILLHLAAILSNHRHGDTNNKNSFLRRTDQNFFVPDTQYVDSFPAAKRRRYEPPSVADQMEPSSGSINRSWNDGRSVFS